MKIIGGSQLVEKLATGNFFEDFVGVMRTV